MNIAKMRNFHLYLGCFFAPLLVFFIVSGCLQSFEWHEAEDGRNPPAILKILSQVHMHQRLTQTNQDLEPSVGFRFLVLFMSLGLTVTMVLGVIMALKSTAPWKVGVCLLLGVLIPLLLLWVSRG